MSDYEHDQDRNVVILRGAVTNDATSRQLATGALVVQFDVTTRDDGGTVSVPVAWFDPPAAAVPAAGDAVVLLGTVRRRFFRSGGATQSRTEVVVERLAPVGRRAAARKLLDVAGERLAG